MDDRILQNHTAAERSQILRDTSEGIEELTYFEEAPAEVIEHARIEVSNDMIKLGVFEDQLKEFKREHKLKTTPLKETVKTNLEIIATGGKQVTKEVFILRDDENQMLGFYSEDGKLVQSRKMLPHERQTSLLTPVRTGTN